MHICAGPSAQMIKGHKCPSCTRRVHDKKHPEQCVVLFQVCLCWHRVHSDSKRRGHGPTQEPNLETRSLHAFFTKRPRKPSLEPASSTEPAPHTVAGDGSDPTLVRIRSMTRHGNTCYVSYVLHAISAWVDERCNFDELSFLLQQCTNHDRDAINL